MRIEGATIFVNCETYTIGLIMDDTLPIYIDRTN